MFFTHLLPVYCALALFEQGLCSTIRPETPEDEPTTYVVYHEKKSWDDARDFCDEKGQALAYIMTYQEQKDLRKYIVSNNLLPKDQQTGYWLGARAEDKIWRWEYNEENPRDDNFMGGWQWHKPNYTLTKDGAVPECMELQYIKTSKFTRELSWNNVGCDEKRGFVCQAIESGENMRS